MADEDLRLAARLARAAGLIHPMDWVKVYESHNAYEWTLQKVLSWVDPWGDDRADFSRAVNTAAIIASNQAEPSQGAHGELIEALRKYLAVHDPEKFIEEDKPTLDAISQRVAKRVTSNE